jgi:hypothetical protein
LLTVNKSSFNFFSTGLGGKSTIIIDETVDLEEAPMNKKSVAIQKSMG